MPVVETGTEGVVVEEDIVVKADVVDRLGIVEELAAIGAQKPENHCDCAKHPIDHAELVEEVPVQSNPENPVPWPSVMVQEKNDDPGPENELMQTPGR